jgi:hypothetical protein
MTLIPTAPVLGLRFGIDSILERTEIEYCTLDQIKTYLWNLDLDLKGIDGDPEDEIKRTLSSVKAQVNGWCKNDFNYVRRSEWHDGKAQDTMILRYSPIVDLEYIRAYNIDYQTFFQYSGDEMIVRNRVGMVQYPPLYIMSNPYRAIGASLSGFTFFPGKANIQFLYTSGFMDSEVPPEFSDAVAKWTAGQMLRHAELKMTQGMQQKIVNGVTERYGTYSSMGTTYIEEAKKALLQFRRITIW